MKEPRYSAANIAARWGFLLAVALAPLLFGGNVPLAWGLNGALVGGVLLLFSLDHAVAGRPFPVPPSWIAVPLLAFAAAASWAFVQTAGWTPTSWHHPIWARAAAALGEPIAGSISVNPWETRIALLRLVTAGAVVWLALQIGRDPRWAQRILLCVAVAAAGYAGYGLAVKAAGSNTVLWIENRHFGEVLTSTFVNPNHFAILASLGLIAAVGLLLRDVRRGLEGSGFSGARGAMSRAAAAARALGFHALLIIPLFSALVLTASRAGLLLTIAGMLALLALERARRSASPAPLIVGACVFAGGVYFLGLPVADRLGLDLARTNAADITSRLAIAEIVLAAVRDAPLLGFGYGVFADVFPSYQGSAVPYFNVWREAHNSYLEAILGLGIPAAALLFVAIGVPVTRCFAGALRRRRDHTAPLVGAAATVVAGLHALIDFSIQIQGITLIYCALLGAGCAQSWQSGRGAERRARGDEAQDSGGDGPT